LPRRQLRFVTCTDCRRVKPRRTRGRCLLPRRRAFPGRRSRDGTVGSRWNRCASLATRALAGANALCNLSTGTCPSTGRFQTDNDRPRSATHAPRQPDADCGRWRGCWSCERRRHPRRPARLNAQRFTGLLASRHGTGVLMRTPLRNACKACARQPSELVDVGAGMARREARYGTACTPPQPPAGS
jgi:hypothetical protein